MESINRTMKKWNKLNRRMEWNEIESNKWNRNSNYNGMEWNGKMEYNV